MKCPKCGKEIANDSRFCEYCGTKLSSSKRKKIIVIAIGILLIFILFVSWAVSWGASERAYNFRYPLVNDADSINYALGFFNGVDVKDYYLADDDCEEAVNEFLNALDNAYNGKDRQNENLKKHAHNPVVIDVAHFLAGSIHEQEKTGLMDIPDIKADYKRFRMGFRDGLYNRTEIFDMTKAEQYIITKAHQYH